MTGPGARELAARVASPLRDVAAINARLDAVSFLIERSSLRDDLRAVLKAAPDIARAVSRLALGRGGPRDLGAVRDGIVAARDPHFFKEHGLPHHRPEVLLLWEADQPDHAEDVTAFVDTKLDALEAHESQFESTMKAVDPEQMAAFRARIRTRLEGLGRPLGIGAAEVFKRIADL